MKDIPGKQRKIRSSLCLTELLYINEAVLENDAYSYHLLTTIRHEARHCYQHKAINILDKTGVVSPYAESRETLISWAINICDYIQPSQDKAAYKDQPIEKDAFWFGH